MPARFHPDLDALPRRPDVVIAGGGIAGLATAFFLSQAGVRPLLLERLPALAMLATRRSGEGVRAQWENPANIAAARASIDVYADFEALTGRSAGYRPIGYLYASRTEEGAKRLEARAGRQRAAGLDDIAHLTGAALREAAPMLAPDATGGIFRQRDGVVEVDAIIAGYLDAMEADIVTDAGLLYIRPGARGVALRTTAGAIETDALVIAAAVRLPGLLMGLDAALPLRLARSAVQYVTLEGIDPAHPAVVDIDLASFWRPDRDGARLTAAFRTSPFLDTFADDPPVGPDYLSHALQSVAPLTPFFGDRSHMIAGGHLRTGSLLVTGDGAPLVGALPDRERIFLNTGYGGHGIMMSPEGGRLLAAELTGSAPVANPFRPDRFAAGAPAPPPEPMAANLASDPKDIPAHWNKR